MSVIVDGTNGLIFNDASTQTTAATGFGFKNRIINGDMRIDQRGSASSPVTVGSRAYAVDRWCAEKSGTSGSFTFGQSSTAPAGFTNSFLCTVTTADASVAAGDIGWFEHHIEGYNVADLGWGTASATAVTISFWVRSSLTGTYSIVIQGGSNYSANYTINVADTWEYKTLTIPGPTSGSWNTTNSTGLKIRFALMAGSNYQLAPGAWTGGDYIGSNSQVNWMATNGNTFYITGVQLEKGSTATAFDYRAYGHELAMCQRYFVKYLGNNIYEGIPYAFVVAASSTQAFGPLSPPNVMRTAFSISTSGSLRLVDGPSAYAISSIVNSGGNYSGPWQMEVYVQASGLTTYRTHYISANNSTSAYVYLSAEL